MVALLTITACLLIAGVSVAITGANDLSLKVRYWSLFVGTVAAVIGAVALWMVPAGYHVWWYYKILFIVAPIAMCVWFYKIEQKYQNTPHVGKAILDFLIWKILLTSMLYAGILIGFAGTNIIGAILFGVVIGFLLIVEYEFGALVAIIAWLSVSCIIQLFREIFLRHRGYHHPRHSL
jgi:hypothetical protein